MSPDLLGDEPADADRFDPDYYLRANDDVRALGFDPTDHYVRFGRAEGRPANAAQAARRLGRGGPEAMPWEAARRVPPSSAPPPPPPEQDPTLANRPAATIRDIPSDAADAAPAPADARDEIAGPPGWFDAEWYHQQHRDVRLFDLDPYAHYAEHGHREGRSPNRAMARVGQFGIAPSRSVRKQAAAVAIIADSGLFDANWYCEQYGIAPEQAILHYVSSGAFLGNDPSLFFSTVDYIKANLDIARAGVNPLAHYIEFGFLESRGGVKTLSETRLTTRVWLKGL